MTNVCLKFVPNVFDKNKCQNCFKSKENHSGLTTDNSKIQKKIVGCGYLFISPQGLDFRNISDRAKRWQRRFFTLYDDGELVFSIDENADTIPQGRIHLASCRSVHSGESITGHSHSIALHLESGESYFLRAASRDEMQHWEKLLVAFSAARTPTQTRVFPRSMSGPLPVGSQPQPPPRQQPPRKEPFRNTSTQRMSGKRGEYLETDLDYDIGSHNSFGRSSDRSRRRPNSTRSGERSPDGKELTYLKKGWLFTRGASDTKLQKRWCVLSDGVLSLYRDTLGEEESRPELSLSLSQSSRVVESSEELSYGFTVETPTGRFHFTAMTAGIRSNWVAALQTCMKTRRRHTTQVSVGTSELSGDMCDAEVSQILTRRRESPTAVVTSKSSSAGRGSQGGDLSRGSQSGYHADGGRNSHSGEVLAEMYSRLGAVENEAEGLRTRVTDLMSQLESAERRNDDLESECQRLSTQCQRLELDVVERDKLVSLPTDDELKLQRQLAANDEALRASQERCLRAERCVTSINDRLAESLSAADEELSEAVRGREEAEKRLRAAEADRDAAERRLRTERSHWEAALRQNEAENARLSRESARVDQIVSSVRVFLPQPVRSVEEAITSLADLRKAWEEDTGPGSDLLALLRRLAAQSSSAATRCRHGLLLSHLAARLGGSTDIHALSALLQLPDHPQRLPCISVTSLRRAARSMLCRVRRDAAVRQCDASWLSQIITEAAVERITGTGAPDSVRQLLQRLLNDVDNTRQEKGDAEEWRELPRLMVIVAALRNNEMSLDPLSDEEWTKLLSETQSKVEEVEWSKERIQALEREMEEKKKEIEKFHRLSERFRQENEAKDQQMAAMISARRKTEEENSKKPKPQQREGKSTRIHSSTNTPNRRIRDLSLPPQEEDEENTLEFWKTELKQILEDELRMISSPINDLSDSDANALLQQEREQHARELQMLRQQFEEALEEEAKSTRIAIEAIERNYKEKLEMERNSFKLREIKSDGESPSRFEASQDADERLTKLARRLSNLYGRQDHC